MVRSTYQDYAEHVHALPSGIFVRPVAPASDEVTNDQPAHAVPDEHHWPVDCRRQAEKSVAREAGELMPTSRDALTAPDVRLAAAIRVWKR